MWVEHPVLAISSAGTSPNARRHISEDDLRWRETIFVMEERRKSRQRAEFGRLVENLPIQLVDIPDD